jgi:hypothetical protein
MPFHTLVDCLFELNRIPSLPIYSNHFKPRQGHERNRCFIFIDFLPNSRYFFFLGRFATITIVRLGSYRIQ